MKILPHLVVLVALFAVIGQVGADLYLPSLPNIGEAFNVSGQLVQATVFLYMVGLTLSRLLYGPLSDAIGRKKPLILGMVLCFGGTFLCMIANSMTMLLIGRFIQGFGAGSGMVIIRAIIRDRLEGKELARVYSYLVLIGTAFIAIVPLLGGYITALMNWRAVFIILFIYTGAALFVSIYHVPETNQYRSIAYLKPHHIMTNLYTLFSNRAFVVYNGCLFLVYGGILAWMTLGSILLQKYVHCTPVQFGWLVMLIRLFHMGATMVNSKVIERVAINKLITMGIWLVLGSGLLMLALYMVYPLTVWIIILPVVIFMAGAAFVFPNVNAGALAPFPKIAGIAGAMTGCIQILGGAITSGLMTLLPDNTQLPLALIFIIYGSAALFLMRSLSGR